MEVTSSSLSAPLSLKVLSYARTLSQGSASVKGAILFITRCTVLAIDMLLDPKVKQDVYVVILTIHMMRIHLCQTAYARL